MVFKGGNEYHHFNSKNTEYPGEHIKRIGFSGGNFHFHLNTDEDRSFQPYETKKDLNGRFLIDKDNSDHPETEADYVYVHFSLKSNTSPADGHFYVAGAFNGWKYKKENRMDPHPDRKVFEKSILLKQGYYDFKYVFKTGNTVKSYYISGNHYQTENDYLIFVYYSDYTKGYDRLIGHTLVNSSQIAY
jgi:hypothetical protein